MKRIMPFVHRWSPLAAPSASRSLAQSVPEINYDANADILNLPSFGEVAGVATNSKGHVFVYARTGHAVATLGDERTFYHGGSRLFQFDQAGKFVKEIGQGVYSVNFAQQVRVDPQDNIWIVDAGSNQVVKFDPDGRLLLVLGRKPESITLRPGPGVPARAHRRRSEATVRLEGGRGGGGGGRGGGADLPAPASTATTSTGRRTSPGIAPATSTSPTGSAPTTGSRSSRRTGTSMKSWGQTGSGQGQFNKIRGIATDAAGNLYVADAGNKRIQVFDGEGTFKSQITSVGTPQAICISGGATQYLLQLQLERSREHGQRRDLQAAARTARSSASSARPASCRRNSAWSTRSTAGRRTISGSARSGTGARRR